MKKISITCFFEILLIVFFLGFILLPPFFTLISPTEGWSKSEKRELYPFPDLPNDFNSLLQFPPKFESYYNDHFGFRDKLIYRYQRELKKRFGKAGSPKVIQGHDGWLFFAGEDSIDDRQGLKKVSPQELRNWIEKQKQKHEWLAKRGIRYLSFVAPNKHSIYSEYLPKYFETVKGESRYEQLLGYFNNELPPYMIDLQKDLQISKSQKQIYYKTDTHWNMLGAHIAFKRIIDRMKQWYPKENFTTNFNFHESSEAEQGGDLAVMLMLQDSLTEKKHLLNTDHTCAVLIPFSQHLSDIAIEKHKIPFMKGCETANLKALIFRDSFFTHLEPFFSENFYQIIYLWKKYDQANVEELYDFFKPDIVIEESVERGFME